MLPDFLIETQWPYDGIADELGFLPVTDPTISITDRKGRCSQFKLEIPSSFPIRLDVTETVDDNMVTTHVINNPPVLSNMLWVGIFQFNDDTTNAMVITDPTGDDWERLDYVQTGKVHFYVIVKICTGTEGSTFNIVTDRACRVLGQIHRFSAIANTGTVLNDVAIARTTLIGGSAGAREYNPPALNPTTWDVESTTWIAGMTCFGNAFGDKTGDPANYTDLWDTFNDNTVPRMQMHTLKRDIAVASEDPAPFIFISNNAGVSFTIAIRPSGGAPAANRRGRASQWRLQIPPAPDRKGRASQWKITIPDFDKRGRASQFKFTIPSNDRAGRASQWNITIPDFDKRGRVSQFKFTIPDIFVPVTQLTLFTVLAELEVAFKVSLVDTLTNPWLASGSAWFYDLGTKNVFDNVKREITSVTVEGGRELTQANNVFDCRNRDGSWVTYMSQNELYVNPWGTLDPNTVISLVRFKLYFSNYAVHVDGQYYEPRIILDPSDLNIKITTNEMLQGFALFEGQIRLANDPVFNRLLRDYIVIGQRLTLKTLKGVANTVGTKIVGEINRTDPIITLKMWS